MLQPLEQKCTARDAGCGSRRLSEEAAKRGRGWRHRKRSRRARSRSRRNRRAGDTERLTWRSVAAPGVTAQKATTALVAIAQLGQLSLRGFERLLQQECALHEQIGR